MHFWQYDQKQSKVGIENIHEHTHHHYVLIHFNTNQPKNKGVKLSSVALSQGKMHFLAIWPKIWQVKIRKSKEGFSRI